MTLYFVENTRTYCSLHYYTIHLCYIHNLSVFCLKPTPFHLRVNTIVFDQFYSQISHPSTQFYVNFRTTLSFFFFREVFREYIGREKKTNTKKD